jgi:lysophospholipase L1-like esterase
MLIALVFALVVAEVALRVLPQFAFLSDGGIPMYAADAQRGWRLRSNYSERWYDRRFADGGIWVETDELGNRKIAPPEKPKDAAEYRILFVGDSFTFGWGVEAQQTFAALVQEQLNKSLPELRVVAINAGVPAYGPENELETVKQLAAKVKPSLVVLGFTENDLENAVGGRDYQTVKDGWLRTPEDATRDDEFLQRLKRYAFHHSALARLAYRAASAMRGPSARKRGVFLGYTLEVLRKQPAPEVTEAIEKTKRVLGQIKDYCGEQKIAFQIVSFPRSYQIYEEEFLARLKETGVSPADFSAEILSERIRAMCDELAVNYTSVKGPFDAARAEGVERDTLFIVDDGHWTARGHELAAAAMAPAIGRAIGGVAN